MTSQQQVYTYYKRNSKTVLSGYKYCPYCQTKLTEKYSGGKERPTCPACGFILFRNPSPTVCVLIQDEDRLLLGKRAVPPGEGKWAIPSGYIEFEDDYLSTAIYEAKEETGLDVRIHSVFNVISSFYSPRHHFLVVYVIAERVGGELRAGDDMAEVDWFPIKGPLPELAFIEDMDTLNVLAEGNYKVLPITNG